MVRTHTRRSDQPASGASNYYDDYYYLVERTR
jgi:hypothetical protein